MVLARPPDKEPHVAHMRAAYIILESPRVQKRPYIRSGMDMIVFQTLVGTG